MHLLLSCHQTDLFIFSGIRESFLNNSFNTHKKKFIDQTNLYFPKSNFTLSPISIKGAQFPKS